MSEPDSAIHAGDEPSSSHDSENSPPAAGSFLVHSNTSFTQAQPVKIDNKSLGRQRRRRTSPEDFAVLEAAYQLNPKPDKVTRANIVSRVSLGDKEVQIWFQNRRQNDRRRCRPLPPYNSGPSGGPEINSSSLPASNDLLNEGAPNLSALNDSQCADCDEANVPGSQQTVDSTLTEVLEINGAANDTDCLSEQESRDSNTQNGQSGCKRKWRDVGTEGPDAQSAGSSDSQLTTPPSLRISLSIDGEAMVRMEGEKTPSPPKPRDSVRLSFSADGEAVVRTATEPSPLKLTSAVPKQAKFGHLRRSASSISFPTSRKKSEGRNTKPFARSHDDRVWELHCDIDARTALSTSLRRTNSQHREDSSSRRSSQLQNSKPLSRNSNLPNEILEPQIPSVKRTKLTRTMSSVARLETAPNAPTGLKERKFGNGLKDHSGDSDKENWIPGTQISGVRRRVAQKQPARTRGRPVLGQSRKQLEVKTDGNRLKRSTKSVGLPAKSTNDENEERCILGSNPEDDLDCIQGLLSLSQGAWG